MRFALTLLVLAAAVPAGAQSMQGDPEALAMAHTMIERMGGAAIWAGATAMNTVEEAHGSSRRLPTRSESWRWLHEPAIWGHTQSAETDRYFAWTAKSGWRLTDGTLTRLTDVEIQEWRGRWRGNIYVMYHRLAKRDPLLRLAREGERRFGVYDAQTSEKLSWFEVSAGGEITKWGAAFGSGSEEWVYGPLADFGPIRMPAWGARVDGTYRFRYLSVSLSSDPPPVSLDVPAAPSQKPRPRPPERDSQPVLLHSRPAAASLSVADVDVARRWYIDVLGFHESHQKPSFSGPSLRIVFLDLDGFELELIEAKASISLDAIRQRFPAVADRAQVRGFGKLAFEVHDAAEMASRFKQRGVKVVRDEAGKAATARRWFIVEDCDGNWLHFFEPMRPARGM